MIRSLRDKLAAVLFFAWEVNMLWIDCIDSARQGIAWGRAFTGPGTKGGAR